MLDILMSRVASIEIDEDFIMIFSVLLGAFALVTIIGIVISKRKIDDMPISTTKAKVVSMTQKSPSLTEIVFELEDEIRLVLLVSTVIPINFIVGDEGVLSHKGGKYFVKFER